MICAPPKASSTNTSLRPPLYKNFKQRHNRCIKSYITVKNIHIFGENLTFGMSHKWQTEKANVMFLSYNVFVHFK